MLKLLVVLVLVALVVVVARAVRSRGSSDPTAVRDARAAKLAADQATITRQGGQGAGQGGVGGGMGL